MQPHDQQSQPGNQNPTQGSPAQGLIPQQELVNVDVPAHHADELHAHIMRVLAEKPAHRIVTMTMATYGEFPLDYRVLIVIEYV